MTELADVKKGKPMMQFMYAIWLGKMDKFESCLLQVEARKLNHLVRLKYSLDYIGYTVTPLIWAVMCGRYEMAKHLLSHRVIVDRIGSHIRRCGSLCWFSALMKAVENSNTRMVELLLEYGAQVQVKVSGPRSDEEEGATIQYRKHLFPLDLGLGKNLNIYKSLLSRADILLQYGHGKHTCLCYALEQYLSVSKSSRLNVNYILEVIDRGGQVCDGVGSKDMPPGKRSCTYLQQLLWKLKPRYKQADDASSLSHFDDFHCLQLICCTDYAHELSPCYRAFKVYPELYRHALAAPAGKEFDEYIHWIINYVKSPSSLQHISRVVIRRSIEPCSFKKCRQLSLPDRLISYVSLDDRFVKQLKEGRAK